MINREFDKNNIERLFRIFPVTVLLGPRQCGKTTLAKNFDFDYFFDLENPQDLVKFDNPTIFFESLSGFVVIDEIQRKPELFGIIRYIVDNNENIRFLILGSASPLIIKKSGETLAGRAGFYFLKGFRLSDLGSGKWKKHWIRGGFPRSYLAKTGEDSFIWRKNFVSTFLERDIPQLGINIPSGTLRRFWIMLSHYHGQILNLSEIARSFGISDVTVRRYLEILEGTYMIKLLQPWHNNTKKRLVKSAKLYINDSGIFHFLQGINNFESLLSHNKLGASWEGYALSETLKSWNIDNNEAFFWSTYSGAEVDLFFIKDGKKYGIEFKFSETPKITKSMKIAINDLELDRLIIVYPGHDNFPLNEKVKVISISKGALTGAFE